MWRGGEREGERERGGERGSEVAWEASWCLTALMPRPECLTSRRNHLSFSADTPRSSTAALMSSALAVCRPSVQIPMVGVVRRSQQRGESQTTKHATHTLETTHAAHTRTTRTTQPPTHPQKNATRAWKPTGRTQPNNPNHTAHTHTGVKRSWFSVLSARTKRQYIHFTNPVDRVARW